MNKQWQKVINCSEYRVDVGQSRLTSIFEPTYSSKLFIFINKHNPGGKYSLIRKVRGTVSKQCVSAISLVTSYGKCIFTMINGFPCRLRDFPSLVFIFVQIESHGTFTHYMLDVSNLFYWIFSTCYHKFDIQLFQYTSRCLSCFVYSFHSCLFRFQIYQTSSIEQS